MLTGALVQSPSGIVFILVSMVSSGLTTVRRMLPVLIWANVGCCALIFATVLDLHVAILYLVGVAGAVYAFDKSHKTHLFGAVFGIGLLFFGMEMMKAGAEPIKSLPWFTGWLNAHSQSYFLTFLGAGVFSFLRSRPPPSRSSQSGLRKRGCWRRFPR